ncbi:MAG: hypothetical protein OXT09_04925 [Myxococcales bacterium]|nr:hypothetical protein [Myxococcales bacterium]
MAPLAIFAGCADPQPTSPTATTGEDGIGQVHVVESGSPPDTAPDPTEPPTATGGEDAIVRAGAPSVAPGAAPPRSRIDKHGQVIRVDPRMKHVIVARRHEDGRIVTGCVTQSDDPVRALSPPPPVEAR